ncbi:MAG: hypothetical protein JNL53_09985 [Cyclobacteriaceae bacterium]|nr:hypothetical protein [Cyclobacteriaceae bacterium]
MSNPIDQLFKNKLGEHRVAPSAEAWTKVEAGLSKKNNKVLWRVAAVLALFGLLTTTWFYNTETNQEVQQVSQAEINTPESPKTESSLPNVAQTQTEEKKKVSVKEPKSLNKQRASEVAANTLVTEQPKEKEQGALPEFEPIISTDVIAIAKTEKPIVIEFTLDALVTDSQPVAHANEEKNTGFKKIFDKALEIKNGESDFGSLRDAKNELFALDFRKDKTKRN